MLQNRFSSVGDDRSGGVDGVGSNYAALMDEVAPRLEAAIAYLRAQGGEQVVLVAHSLGATMSNQFLAQHPQAATALVAIGLASGGEHDGVDNEALIGHIPVPTLDLFGQHDLEAVVTGADADGERGDGGSGRDRLASARSAVGKGIKRTTTAHRTTRLLISGRQRQALWSQPVAGSRRFSRRERCRPSRLPVARCPSDARASTPEGAPAPPRCPSAPQLGVDRAPHPR